MDITFNIYSFDELTTRQLYAICQLRQEVFIVEQDCPYLDADGRDTLSYHVIGTDGIGVVQAYSRLLPKGVSYEGYASIGRVVNSAVVRGSGVGKQLMKYNLHQIKKRWPDTPIKISAQTYLLKFYKGFGFNPIGEEYLEDNLPHIAMVLD